MSENNKSNLDESLIAELLANRVGNESAPKAPEPEIGITEDLSKVADSGLTAAGMNAANIIDSFMNEGDKKEVIQKQLDAEFDAARDAFRPAPLEKSPSFDSTIEVGDVFLDSKKSLDEVISIEEYKEPVEVAEPAPEEVAPEEVAEPAQEQIAPEEVLEVVEPVVEDVAEPEKAEPETTIIDEKIKANIEELNKMADGFLEEGFSATADATAKSIAALSAALSKNSGISLVPSSAEEESGAVSMTTGASKSADGLENKDEFDISQLDNSQVDKANIESNSDETPDQNIEESDSYDQEEEQGGGLLRTILYTILTIGLLIAAILSVGLTVAKETGFGRAVQSGVDKVQAIFVGEDDEAEAEAEADAANAEAEAEAEATEATGTAAESTDATTNTAEATEATDDGIKHAEVKVTDSVIGKAIQAQVEKSKNIDLIEENIDLKFPAYTIEGAEGADKAIAFDDDFWYVHNNTETKHYSTEIVGFAIDYYSKLMERYNNGDEEILKMIEKDTMLMNGVAAIKSDHLVIHTITKMEIGEMRKLGDELYLILTITERTSDQKADETYTKVMHFNTANTDLKVKEIGDAKPIG